MSQNDFNIANQGFPATRADINSALQALASTSSGATAPSTTYAYQLWYDETADLLKMRNGDNDAWITLAFFDQAADEWEVRTAVVQAVDSAGVVIKTDDGVARISVADSGAVSIGGNLAVDTNTLFVDAANNRVGVGTTGPAALIDASGAQPNFRLTQTDGTGNIEISHTGSAYSYGGIGANQGAIYTLDDLSLMADGSHSLKFHTNAAERMRITPTGSVGIGTSSPSYRLDVSGAIRGKIDSVGDGTGVLLTNNGSTNGRIDFLTSDSSGRYRLDGIGDTRFAISTVSGGVYAEALSIDRVTRNVGIGTSSPLTNLHVSVAALSGYTGVANSGLLIERGNGPAALNIASPNTESGFIWFADQDSASVGNIAYNHASNFMSFQTNGSERARIGASGNLLVGTTSSTGSRITLVAGAAQNAMNIIVPTVDYFGTTIHNQATSGDNVFVAFGTEASFTSRGGITYNRSGGLIAYNTTSDYRAKDIAGPIADASGAVLSLKPYMGTMKGATVGRPMFVAHETQEIAPYAVTGEKDAVDKEGNPKYQQMDHSALVPLLTAALQEALQKIEALEARITALEA